MAKTRPLVGGYLERISVKAFEKFYKEITDLVQSQHGVYALYKRDRLYYVGLAVDLRRRVKQHVRDKHAGKWNRFSLYLVRKVDHIKEIESLLLRIADPTGNVQVGRLRRAVNLKSKLRRLMHTRVREEVDEILADRGLKVLRSGRRTRLTSATKGKQRQPRRLAKKNRPLRGLIAGGKRIYGSYKGKDYTAVVFSHGRIKLSGKFYDTPSAAAYEIRKRPTNGWTFSHIRKDGELVKLAELRAKR